MERRLSLKQAHHLFKENFIGTEELYRIKSKLDINFKDVPEIPFTPEELKIKAQEGYILFLGGSFISKNIPITILSLRNFFGINPSISEPCFYNQDWYDLESFANKSIENKWYLIKKSIFNESRAIHPNYLFSDYKFPSAIICAYLFFIYWLCNNECLWESDFVWCSDFDSNGDRVYVGKYKDLKGTNKSGFSVHRHLSLNNFYGSINLV